MKRLRLVFCVLAGLLWLPLLGLVFHAVRSAEQEEAGRYQAVAERLFDEMERELTQLLEREQQRPLADYDFTGSTGPDSDAPCVLGYFERSSTDQLSHGPWRHSADEIEQALSASRQLMAATTPGVVRDQAPGSTQALAQVGPPSKTYDALSSLNRGAWSRSQSESRRGIGSLSQRSPSAATPAARISPSETEYPLQAVPGSERFLILVRSVPRAGASVTQGLVIDPRELLDWVRARAIPDGELQRAAELSFVDAGARGAAPTATAHRYRHRFGEPFSALSAQLELKRLVDLETGDYVYVLSALLVSLGALGLIGGYRMVAAIVGYAERRSNFVSAVTHELKTPLTSIRMYGEMLRDNVVPDPEKRSRYYRIITAESERLTRLIDNVLELAKLERGSRQLSLAMGQVGQVVRDTLEVLEPHATELGFQLELEEEAALPAVSFDRDALAQVLFNLVDNALKYGSESQQRTIKIRCERAAAGVCIRVADRGPGVDPAHLRQIWQPFFRGERELTRKHKGTGIGLSLVRGLVQRMGGSVSGKNTYPGFEVSVTLP